MQIHIELPPTSIGSNPEMKALFDYLYKTAEYLNVVLNNIGEENLSPQTIAMLKAMESSVKGDN